MIYKLYQEFTYFIVHHFSTWVFIGFSLSAVALWILAGILFEHPDKDDEARFAFRAALANLGLGLTLMSLKILFS